MRLSHAQNRLWFLQHANPASPAYNIADSFQLEGPLDVAALERALHDVVLRHEPLHTRIPVEDGAPAPVLDPPGRFSLGVTDLSHAAGEARRVAEERIIELGLTPFVLERELPLRAYLFRLAPDWHILTVVFHHIATDGWSMGIFRAELAVAYSARRRGQAPEFEALAATFSEVCERQRAALDGGALEKQLSYWRRALEGAPATSLMGQSSPEEQPWRGDRVYFTLPQHTLDGMDALGRRVGATRFMVALAALNVLLHRYGCGDDITVGSPIANRAAEGAEPLIGFFANTLVFRSDLAGNPTFSELLARVRDRALDVYAHQETPYEAIVDALRAGRADGSAPLFGVALAYHNALNQELRLEGLRTQFIPIDSRTSKFEVLIAIEETPGEPYCFLEYATRLHDRRTMERFTRQFVRLLEEAARAPEVPIGRMRLLSEPERRLVLGEWAGEARPYPAKETVHGMFERRVRERPDAIALVWRAAISPIPG
ncbi:MAG: hypothetical protein FJW40_23315 [Acidobacteria bacterium]|nr:hypothetical protein [Acidobacteriota bacterium]